MRSRTFAHVRCAVAVASELWAWAVDRLLLPTHRKESGILKQRVVSSPLPPQIQESVSPKKAQPSLVHGLNPPKRQNMSNSKKNTKLQTNQHHRVLPYAFELGRTQQMRRASPLLLRRPLKDIQSLVKYCFRNAEGCPGCGARRCPQTLWVGRHPHLSKPEDKRTRECTYKHRRARTEG